MMKNQKIKISTTYVNAHGQIVKSSSNIVNLGFRIRKMFKALPFMVSFMLCALLFVQIFCIVGIISTLTQPTNIGDFGVYVFLFFLIAMTCTLGFGAAWYLTEESNKATGTRIAPTRGQNSTSINSDSSVL